MFKKLLKNTDYVILGCVLFLFIIGVIGIYSAGYNSSVNNNEYIKQMIWFAGMTVVMIIIWAIDYNIFDIGGYILYIISTIMLVAVLFMPKIMGAKSWFNFGFFLYQPSELMKIAYILVFSKMLTSFNDNSKRSKILKFVSCSIAFLIPFVLIILQPDFGTAATFIVITIFMLFMSGIKYRYILIGIAAGVILIPIVYFFILSPYQQNRIQVFIHPDMDPLGSRI